MRPAAVKRVNRSIRRRVRRRPCPRWRPAGSAISTPAALLELDATGRRDAPLRCAPARSSPRVRPIGEVWPAPADLPTPQRAASVRRCWSAIRASCWTMSRSGSGNWSISGCARCHRASTIRRPPTMSWSISGRSCASCCGVICTTTCRRGNDRRLILENDLTHAAYVNRAFDQIRLAGASQSAIAAILIQTLGRIAADLERDQLPERAAAVRLQGALTLATYEAGSPLPHDLARVRALAERHGFAIRNAAAGMNIIHTAVRRR